MPLERGKAARRLAEHRIGGRLGGELDLEHADLRLGSGIDARSERAGEQLRSQAHAPDRVAGLGGFPERPLLGRQPGMRVLLVGAHRPAHDDRGGKLAPVGERVALVALCPHQVEAARAQLVLEGGRRLAGDVLQDEQGRRVQDRQTVPGRAPARYVPAGCWAYGCGSVAVAPTVCLARRLPAPPPAPVRVSPVPPSAPRPVSERTYRSS